ncbi:MAG: class I SAM-dependent methyltransferase [Pseudomonadota bacterium]
MADQLPLAGAFETDRVLPWGRNRVEYSAFFDLGDLAPPRRILDCAGGPSSFAAEMAEAGFEVTATDPLYRLSEARIASAIEEARQVMTAGVRAAWGRFCWHDYGSPEGLEATRLSTMKFFLEDYEEGQFAGRYVPAALPDLPFADDSFDLALVSHFLFTYSDQLDLAFHQAALAELLRLAPEVRIFPLLDLEGGISRHLVPLRESLNAKGLFSEVRMVPYEFQRGGNRMLRVRREAPK